MSESKPSGNDAARTVEAHGSRPDTTTPDPADTTPYACPPWCTRTHPDGFPVGYCESAPLVTWEKTPGDVRAVTAIRFVPAVAEQVRAPEMVAVKGGDKPTLFTLDEARTLARVIGIVPGAERLDERAAELFAA